jgi:ubiquitin C-terminal hydrolase
MKEEAYMNTKKKIDLPTLQTQSLKQVALMFTNGENTDAFLSRWKNFIHELVTSNSSIDVDALIQLVFSEVSQQEKDALQSLIEELHNNNERKKSQRDYMQQLQEEQRKGEELIRDEYQKLQSLDDESQLVAVKLQNQFTKAQQHLQNTPNLQKVMQDIAIEIIKNLKS